MANRELLEAALIGYQRQHAILGQRIAEITEALSGSDKSATAAPHRSRRPMSAEAKKRIGDAARKRWAAFRAAKKKRR